MPKISVIIPLYNEEKRILGSLKILENFINKNINIEIIFVSDGSNDKTNQLVKSFISKNKNKKKLKFITYRNNVGKGYAIKKGLLKAKNQWQLICDADMSVNPSQLIKWFDKKLILNDKQAYYGSRKLKNSRIETTFLRNFLGSIFTKIINIFFKIDIKDTQCGFKVFNKKYSTKIFKKLTSYRFAFDIELTLLLKKHNIVINELPLNWTHKKNSKLSLVKDMPIMLYDIFIIKLKEIF